MIYQSCDIMAEANYRIKYKNGDFELEVQGDKVWVNEKFKELFGGFPNKPQGTTTFAGVPPSANTPVVTNVNGIPDSLIEFLKAKRSPNNQLDLAIVFSYWLRNKKKLTSYNKDDIESCFDEARITKPLNITDIMNKNQRKGYLMPPAEKLKDAKKAWIITQTGEDYVKQMNALSVSEAEQKRDKRGGPRSAVISPVIDDLLRKGFLDAFKTGEQVFEELKRNNVPVKDVWVAIEALNRRVPKTLDRIKDENGKWLYRKKA